MKLVVREMPTIPLMSYNVFTVMDDTYWTGYPSAESAPYTDPVPNWANTKYMMVKLKPDVTRPAQDQAPLERDAESGQTSFQRRDSRAPPRSGCGHS